MTRSPCLEVREVQLLERAVRLRLPFRYGAVTLREAPQAFVRARVEMAGRSAWGVAAEMLAPKWFDKNPTLTDAQNIDQLRGSLAHAADHFLDAGAGTAFQTSLGVRDALAARSGSSPRNGLVEGYGPALLERAVLDAALRIVDLDFARAIRCNVPGISFEALAPDLVGFHGDTFLAGLEPAARVAARHTVGMADPLEGDSSADAPDDGLPVTLEQIVACYGNRWFKVKLGGEVEPALERMMAVAATLDRVVDGDYGITLDGNEQYAGVDALAELAARASREKALARFLRGVAFFEQPFSRDVTPDLDVRAIAATWPLIIDESDSAPEAFRVARARGYSGVSTKQCKGFYKALTNAARCAAWNAEAGRHGYFMSAEDLTCQGGISVQQDLAIAATLGITQVERNGHHFGGPMPDASPEEQRAFLDAHPDLYEPWGEGARLRIKDGRIALGSLWGPGFAHGADPDFHSMSEMVTPTSL